MSDPLGPKLTAELEKLVNTSGFPFQLRVQHEVQSTSQTHGWRVSSREHPWAQSRRAMDKEHFLDLVLEKGRMRLAVECKRAQNASWVFLTDPREALDGQVGRSQIRARVFWAHDLKTTQALQEAAKSLRTWWDFDVRPESVESEFCVVRGSGEDQSPLLERLGRHVVDAAEEVGHSAVALGENFAIMVAPVIVTNARLYACAVDPANISLSDGKLTAPLPYVTVPYIRFRKSLALDLTKGLDPIRGLAEADQNRQRTVFVVNSEHLITVLSKWRMDPLGEEIWPHEAFVKLAQERREG